MSSVLGAAGAGLVLALELAALGVAGARLGRWLEPEGDGWDRWLAGLVGLLAGVVAVLTALGMVGLLHPVAVAVATVGASVAVIRFVPDPGTASETRARAPGAPVLGVAVTGAVVAAHYIAAGAGGRTTERDSLHYHVPLVGEWLNAGSLWGLPFAVPGYATNAYPAAFELAGAVWMAPTGSDQFLYLSVVPWAALAVLGVAVTARELGGAATAGALLALAVIATPLVVWTQAASLNSDLAAAGGIVAAIALVLRVTGTAAPRGRTAALAGLALGLATASKYTSFIAALGVVILGLALARPEQRRRVATGVLGGAAALTGFWLLRDLLATGNPLFPFGGGPLRGAESPLTRYELPLAGHLLDGRWHALRTWFSLARRFFGFAALVVPLGLLAIAAPRERRRFWVGLVLLVTVLGYAITPYTGGGEEAVVFLIGSQLRYAAAALLIGAALSAALLGRLAGPAAALVLAWDAWRLREGSGLRPEVDLHRPSLWWAVGLGAGATWFALRLTRADRPTSWSPLASGAAVAAVLAPLAAGILLVQGDRPASTVERLLDATGRPRGPVAVVVASDVRSLQGKDFEVELVKPSGGGAGDERPVLDPDELDRQLRALDPAVVVFEPGTLLTPPGWTPGPDWRLVDRQGRAELYLPAG